MRIRFKFFVFAWCLVPSAQCPVFAAPADDPSAAYLKGLVHEKFGRPEDALAFYRRAVALDPSSLFLHRTIAELCLRLRLLDDALSSARAAAALAGADPDARILVGRAHLARGDRASASLSFDEALALAPGHDEALLYAAYTRAAAQPADAIRFLERYLQQNPGSPEALVRIAELRETLGDAAAAEAAWRRAAERDPSNPEVHVALGRMAEGRGDRKAAAASYEAARFLSPEDVSILVPLGEAYHRLGRAAEARETLEKALRLDPDNAGALFGLALSAEEAQDWDLAARHMSAAAEKSDIPGLMLRLAYEQTMGGRPKEALQTLRRLHKRTPRDPDVLVYMGLAYEDLDRRRPALKSFLAALELDPSRADAHYHAGVNWDALKQFDKAEPHLERAVVLQPRHASALNHLGYSWADRGVRLEEALALIRRALVIDADNPAFLDSLGWCLFKLGRLEEASSVLSRAALAAEDAVVWEHCGDAFRALGKDGEAFRAWEEGLLADPQSKTLRRRLGKRAENWTVVPMSAARSTLKRAEADFISLRGVAGAVTVAARRGPAAMELDGIFYYRKPGEFRLEALGPFMVPVAVAVRTPKGFRVRPEDAIVPPGAEAGLNLLASVLSGAETAFFDDPSVRVDRRGSLLTYRGSGGELEIDGRRKVLTRVSRNGVQVFLDNYREIEGVRWPGTLRLESRGGGSLTFTFKSPRVNPRLADALFDLP